VSDSAAALLSDGPRIANVGVRHFAEALLAQRALVVQGEWSPPPELDADLGDLLDALG
jgi:hypothetical protein